MKKHLEIAEIGRFEAFLKVEIEDAPLKFRYIVTSFWIKALGRPFSANQALLKG